MLYRELNTELSSKIEASYHLGPLASKVLASKSKIAIKDFLEYVYHPPTFEMMDDAVAIIKDCISNNKKILILGDYDADGILATSILVKAFEYLDYSNFKYHIPNRLSEGYGLNIKQVEKAKSLGFDCILTVDNGINAVESIKRAKDLGLSVIISDHHKVNEEFIVDVAYLHPQLSNLDYPISGGMVAYYLACALLDREDDYLLALGSITTISDVMPISKGNRKLVRKGLGIINSNHYEAIQLLSSGFIDSNMIGTIISPKINSLGRLPDYYNPNHLVVYFTSNDSGVLRAYIKEIEDVNAQRKELSNYYYDKHKIDGFDDKVLFVNDRDMHEGVIGLLATRFSNEYNCISVISTDNEDEYKASLRSVDNIDIFEIVKANEHLFSKYGGHKLAMGMSFKKENLDAIKDLFHQALEDVDIKEKNYDVIKVEASEISVDSVKEIRRLEPFGNGFEQPNFLIEDGIVASIKPLSKGLHHKVNLLYKDNTLEMMFFFSSDLDLSINDSIDVIVSAGINEFRGNESVSCIVQEYQKK